MIKNLFSNWSVIFFSAAAVFITYPLLLGRLGEDQYGVWLLIVSLMGNFTLLQLGVPLANVRFASKYLAEGNRLKLSQVLSTNIAFFIVLGILVLLIGAAAAKYIGGWFDIPEELHETLALAALLAAGEISIRFIFEGFEGVIHARKQFFPLALIRNLATVIRVTALYLYVENMNGIGTVALIIFATTLVQSILIFGYAKYLEPQIDYSRKNISVATFKEIFSFSVFVILIQAATRLSTSIDPIVIGTFIAVGAIVAYSVANSIILYLGEFIVGISRTLMPYVSELAAKEDYEKLSEVYTSGVRYTAIILAPVCLSLIFFGQNFIDLWIGDPTVSTAGAILTVLVIGSFFNLLQRGSAFPIWAGIGSLKNLTGIYIAMAAANITISIFLVHDYGLLGVAWGTSIPHIVGSEAIALATCKLLNVNFLRFHITAFLPAVVSSLGFLGIYYLVESQLEISSFVTLILAIGLCCIGYAVLAGLFFARVAERQRLTSLIRI